MTLNVYRLLFAGLVLLAISVSRWGLYDSLIKAPRMLKATILSGILGFGIGGLCFYSSLLYLDVGKVVIVTAITPVTAQLLSRIVGKEKILLHHVIGGILVALSIVMAYIA